MRRSSGGRFGHVLARPPDEHGLRRGSPPPLVDGGLLAAGGGAQTVLIIAPADSTLLVGAPGVTKAFTATLQGTTTPVTATWSVDLPLVGTIDGNGLFTASGVRGGVVTVSAQTESAHGATTLTVDLQVTADPGDAGAGVIGALRDGGSADSKFRWLYPYDQTVFPRGLTPHDAVGRPAGDVHARARDELHARLRSVLRRLEPRRAWTSPRPIG